MLIRTMQELESQGWVVSISHGKSTAVRLLTKLIRTPARHAPGQVCKSTGSRLASSRRFGLCSYH